jgi:AcrR family transcriptional regulator
VRLRVCAVSASQPQCDRSQSDGSRRRWSQGDLGHLRHERAERVAEFQRLRLMRAASEMACERGFTAGRGDEGLSVKALVARAGVSRRTFYELFDSCDECLLAALDAFFAEIAAFLAAEYEGEGRWSQRLGAALVVLLAFVEREREMAALALSYLLGRGPENPELRVRVLERLRGVVDEGRSQAMSGRALSPLTAELVVASVLTIIHARLQAGPQRPGALVDPLMWMIVLPYLGPAAADRELGRTRRQPAGLSPIGASEPARPPVIRVTYRTARVLEAIALVPGASNIEIGERAGMADPGQVSKLLARLTRLGLIENVGAGWARGAANAWHLTATGRDFESTIRRKPALLGNPRMVRDA